MGMVDQVELNSLVETGNKEVLLTELMKSFIINNLPVGSCARIPGERRERRLRTAVAQMHHKRGMRWKKEDRC